MPATPTGNTSPFGTPSHRRRPSHTANSPASVPAANVPHPLQAPVESDNMSWALPPQAVIERLVQTGITSLLTVHIPIQKHLLARLLSDIAAHLRWLLENSDNAEHNEATQTVCLQTCLLARRRLWTQPPRQGNRLAQYARVNHIRERPQMFRQGHWEDLCQLLLAHPARPAKTLESTSPGLPTPEQAGRVAQTVQQANLPSAWRQLWSHGVASPTQTTADVLLEQPLEKALLSFKPGKAIDSMGWAQHTRAQLCQWSSLRPHVLHFLDRFIRDCLQVKISQLCSFFPADPIE